jgi:hypothetical protein
VIDDNTTPTLQGYAYDPAAGAWLSLPGEAGQAADVGEYSMISGACGFYVFADYLLGASSYAEQLPGYGDCGGENWMTASSSAATIAPGQSATVTVSLNAAEPSVTETGSYTATLELGNDTPYGTLSVPVTMTVTPPGTDGQITGTVEAETCSGATSSLAGATVQVDGTDGTWVLTSGTTGGYSQWLDAGNDPLTLIVSASGYESQTAKVTVTAGATTTQDFTLTPDACG